MDVFYVNRVKHHIVHRFDDCGNKLVAHKSWSKRKQRWVYFVDSEYFVKSLQLRYNKGTD